MSLRLTASVPPAGKLSGQKYNYGHRSGLASTKDQEVVQRNIKKEEENIGSMTYAVRLLDPVKRTVLKGGTIDLGGRTFQADANGDIIIGDTGAAKKRTQKYVEIQQYINNIIDYFLVNDEISAELLGMDPGEYVKNIVASQDGAWAKKYGVTDTIAGVDCSARIMSRLTPTSEAYALCVAKMRAILEYYMPCLDGEQNMPTTNASAINAGQE